MLSPYMIKMEKFKGEDIEFTLFFKKGECYNIESFRDLESIVAYLYTDSEKIIKFSANNSNNTHYQTLTYVNNYTLKGLLTGDVTKTLNPGLLNIEVYASYKNQKAFIYKGKTAMFIKEGRIK